MCEVKRYQRDLQCCSKIDILECIIKMNKAQTVNIRLHQKNRSAKSGVCSIVDV